jgi:hypothetical protein
MAVHRRVRKVARAAVAHARRGGRALPSRRAPARNDRDPKAIAIDERLHALTEYVRASRHYEGTWQIFRFGQFKGLTDEEATLALAAWARRQRIEVGFEVRKVRHIDVLFVVLRSSDQ